MARRKSAAKRESEFIDGVLKLSFIGVSVIAWYITGSFYISIVFGFIGLVVSGFFLFARKKKYNDKVRKSKINDVDTMTGTQFEYYLKLLFERQGYNVIDKLGKGRSSNFLPLNYAFIVPQSTIVPRLTQGMQKLHEMSKQGINPAAINFICGSSSSSAIELNKVWGVHGPIRLPYLIVSDL